MQYPYADSWGRGPAIRPRPPRPPAGTVFSIYERQLFVDGGTWTSTLPQNPDPGMAALFAELDAGTLELWEGIDGVYRIYEPGPIHRLMAELPKDDDAEWHADVPCAADGTSHDSDETQDTNPR